MFHFDKDFMRGYESANWFRGVDRFETNSFEGTVETYCAIAIAPLGKRRENLVPVFSTNEKQD